MAKNLVAAGAADQIEIELAYAIGVAKPVSIAVDTFGTGKYTEEKITEVIEKVFDLRPKAIISELDLKRPIYRQTAAYGHFGRTDIDLPWERLDKVDPAIHQTDPYGERLAPASLLLQYYNALRFFDCKADKKQQGAISGGCGGRPDRSCR